VEKPVGAGLNDTERARERAAARATRIPTATPEIRIGTSGWCYPHWRGRFYPRGLSAAGELAFYARHFGSVEINNTFYRLPERRTLAAWRDSVPRDFLFAVKASRYLTHMKKLAAPAAAVRRFFRRIEVLGGKLGPVLFQLPPRWRCDAPRLGVFLDALPGGLRYAFEFRDRSWLTEAVYDALARRNAALCIYELASFQSPARITADFAYVRLHGPAAAYRGCYSPRALTGWARRLRQWAADGLAVYCYFDNDEAGYAAHNALQLVRISAESSAAAAARASAP
jgi:uncharacterized protein YecE (DUF72 family)